MMAEKSFRTWQQKQQGEEKNASADRIFAAVARDSLFMETLKEKLMLPAVKKNIQSSAASSGMDASTRDWSAWLASFSDQDINDIACWLALEGLGGSGKTPLMKRSAREVSPLCTSQLKIALRKAILEDPSLAALFAGSSAPKSSDEAILGWLKENNSPATQVAAAKKMLDDLEKDTVDEIKTSLDAGIIANISDMMKEIKNELDKQKKILSSAG